MDRAAPRDSHVDALPMECVLGLSWNCASDYTIFVWNLCIKWIRRLSPARSTPRFLFAGNDFCQNFISTDLNINHKVLSNPSAGMNLCPLKSWQSGTVSQVNSIYSHRSSSSVVSDHTAFSSSITLLHCWYSLMLHFLPSELSLIYRQHVIVFISRSSWQRDGLHQLAFSPFRDQSFRLQFLPWNSFKPSRKSFNHLTRPIKDNPATTARGDSRLKIWLRKHYCVFLTLHNVDPCTLWS